MKDTDIGGACFGRKDSAEMEGNGGQRWAKDNKELNLIELVIFLLSG